MDIILAVVVVFAVIFFGALISIGNERQRHAIDNLREKISLWAIQDLKTKQEGLAGAMRVADPLSWFGNFVSTFSGHDVVLEFLESFDELQGLMFASKDDTRRIVFSPLSPADIQRIKKRRNKRLSPVAENNPLWNLPKSTEVYELSALNGGIFLTQNFSLFGSN